MPRDRRRAAYCDQRYLAKYRGIGWDFPYDDWLAWWETNLGPDWIELRGCRKGQYVMARRGDAGSYRADNVECITAEENHRRYNRNRRKPTGQWSWRLDDAIVQAIYLDERSYQKIADEFGTKRNTVHRIKTRRNYAHLTRGLDEPKRRMPIKKKSDEMSQINFDY